MFILSQALFLIAGIVLLLIYIFRNQNNNMLGLLEILAIVMDILGRFLIACSHDLNEALIGNKIQYIGGICIPLFLILILIRICNIQWLKWLPDFLIGCSIVLYGFVLTIGQNTLYYKTVSLGHGDGYSYLIKEYGIMHGVYVALILFYFVLLCVMLIYAIKNRNIISVKMIRQAVLAGTLTIGLYVIEKLTSINFGWKPLIYIISGSVLLIISEKVNMFDMSTSIASAIERMNEYGYIIFDRKCHYINSNHFAKELLPEMKKWKSDSKVTPEESIAYQEIVAPLLKYEDQEEKHILKVKDKYIEITTRFMYYRGKRPVGYLVELLDKTTEYHHIDTIQEYNERLQKQIQETEISRQNAERSKEEAKRANHAKSDFLSRMSHDIRTPINGIIGMIHIVEDNLEDQDKAREGLEKIKSVSQQLELLLSDILDMSRLESGKIQLTKEIFDIEKILMDCFFSIRVMAEDKGIVLEETPFIYTHKTVVGSPGYLQRIIMNVLTNSVKYNKIGGMIRYSCYEKNLDETHSQFRIVVQDSGIGMTQDFLNKIYDPFERAKENEGSTTYEGSGLGMAITKELVELMGGTIEIKSVLGEGTIVTLKIPLEICEETNMEDHRESERLLENIRILVVEDNELNMEIITYVLKEQGIIVDAVSDGVQAVERFKNSEPGYYEFILMDVMMPIMNGLDATRAIRALNKEDAKKVPIIAMTANVFEQDIKECLEAGMNEHVAKPLDMNQLIMKLLKYRK